MKTNEELRDLAVKECEKIPSNDKILYKSEEINHTIIERRIGDDFKEKHIITIEWVQIKDKEEK